MLIIKDVLISDDVVEKRFHCNLAACKGACCWEGDYGAPLEKEELATLQQIYPLIRDQLTVEGRAVLDEKGTHEYYEDISSEGTPLVASGACAYLTVNELGIAQCGIESAHNEGIIDFKKPVSCHLYPLRVKTVEEQGFTAVNYDSWEICSPACELGEEMKLPVYRFVREGLVRKFGADFYEQLDAAARHLEKK